MSARSIRAAIDLLERDLAAAPPPYDPPPEESVTAEHVAAGYLAGFETFGFDTYARRLFAAGSDQAGQYCVDAVYAVAGEMDPDPAADRPADGLWARSEALVAGAPPDPGFPSEAHSALVGCLQFIFEGLMARRAGGPETA